MTLFSYWRTLLNLSLTAVIGYDIVTLILLEPPTIPHYPTATVADNITIAKTKLLNITPLLNSHLFGETTTLPSSHASPPVTQLSLQLRGIFFAPSGNRSSIMVAEDKGKSELYKLNGILPGGAKVYEIREKEVILLRNGRYEMLKLEGSQSISAPMTVQINKTNEVITNNITPPEQLLGQFQQQLQTNPEALTQLLKVNPVVEAGRFMGYQLSPGKNAALMGQFNLQAGDILTKINEVVLDSPLKGLDILPILATTDRVDLQILRNGQLLSLSFTVQH